MARDFTISYDYSRISGTVNVSNGYVPVIEAGGNGYLSTYDSSGNVYIPSINIISNYVAQIPIIQQVPCSPSLKNTGYPYKVTSE